MYYVRELAKLNNESLSDSNLCFHKLSCFQNRVICRIVASEYLPNGRIIYYGIDSNGIIYFGPLSQWESLFYNYDLLLEFARDNRVIEYNKTIVKKRIRGFFNKKPNVRCGIIGL